MSEHQGNRSVGKVWAQGQEAGGSKNNPGLTLSAAQPCPGRHVLPGGKAHHEQIKCSGLIGSVFLNQLSQKKDKSDDTGYIGNPSNIKGYTFFIS